MEEITITRKDLIEAAANATCNGLHELVEKSPTTILLIPVVIAECWKELLKMKGEGNDEGKAD